MIFLTTDGSLRGLYEFDRAHHQFTQMTQIANQAVGFWSLSSPARAYS